MTEPEDWKSEAGRAADDGGQGSAPEEVPEWLGAELRRAFTDVMSEPIPEELKRLLNELAQRDRQRH